jgi:hypothetical protein
MLIIVGFVLGLAILLAARMQRSGRQNSGWMSEQWLVEYKTAHPSPR